MQQDNKKYNRVKKSSIWVRNEIKQVLELYSSIKNLRDIDQALYDILRDNLIYLRFKSILDSASLENNKIFKNNSENKLNKIDNR